MITIYYCKQDGIPEEYQTNFTTECAADWQEYVDALNHPIQAPLWALRSKWEITINGTDTLRFFSMYHIYVITSQSIIYTKTI